LWSVCTHNPNAKPTFFSRSFRPGATLPTRSYLEAGKPITRNAPLLYRFALPNANHVFLPGHRIMVQVQSSWFPLYDRNPQTFVPSIFWAKPSDYRKATQRVFSTSFVELPVSR